MTAVAQEAHWKAAAAAPLVACVAIVLMRLRYFHEPFDNDIPIRFAYAFRALAGAEYYRDLHLAGPPGGLWIVEFFVSLFGLSDLAVFVMGCFFSVLAATGVYATALKLGGRLPATLALAMWVICAGDLLNEANQPNTESFINAALVWGLYLCVRNRGSIRARDAALAGLLFFAASTVKHFVLVIPLMGLIFYAAYQLWHDGIKTLASSRFWGPFLACGASIAIGWVLLVGWYSATDRLPALFTALVGESVQYAGNMPASRGDLVS